VVDSGSKIIVRCFATPDLPIQIVDVDGGQAPRDVTFEAICVNAGTILVNRKLSCGKTGSINTVIGRARIRYENNYDQTKYPIASRAVVPKILGWTIWS
jgi:hypothetical protein